MSKQPPTERAGRSDTHALAHLDLIFLATAVVGGLIVIFRESLLPARFFYDGERIQEIASGRISALGDQSFSNVAALYRWSGLAASPTVASFVGYALALLLVLVVRRRFPTHRFSAALAVLLSFTVFFSAVYLGYYSKDVVVLFVVLFVLLLPRSLLGEIALLLCLALYAGAVRNYWFLVLILYLYFRIIISRGIRWRGLCVGLLLALVGISLAVSVVYGVNADYFRTSVNGVRIANAQDVNSIINPLIPGSGIWIGVANVVVTFATLIVPLPLATSGSGAYYIAISLLFVTIWFIFGRSLGRGFDLFNGKDDNSRYGARIAAIILAFVAVQALFEPDYGSAIRHTTPILILFVAFQSWSTQLAIRVDTSSDVAAKRTPVAMR